MGALQAKVDSELEDIETKDEQIDLDDIGGPDEIAALDDETVSELMTKLTDQQAAILMRMRAIAAVLEDVRDDGDKLSIDLLHPLEPVNGKGRGPTRVEFPKKVLGKHLRGMLRTGEGETDNEVDMRRVEALSGLPSHMLDRMDQEDVTRLIVVATEVANGRWKQGNLQASTSGSTT